MLGGLTYIPVSTYLRRVDSYIPYIMLQVSNSAERQYYVPNAGM